MYGLRVRSDVRLPLAPVSPMDGGSPAWAFRRLSPGRPAPAPDGPPIAETRCDGPCHGGRVVARVHRGPGGAWFWLDAVGTCHVLPDIRRVDVYPKAGADEHVLGLLLAGHVSVFLLHQIGYPTLHASAVVTEQGTAAFFGPKGRGKSTMAACFLDRGAALLTDDVLPLRTVDGSVHGAPGLALMKVWAATAEHVLKLSEELPNLMVGIEKKLLIVDGRYPLATAPMPLRALYVIDRYDPEVAGRTEVTTRTLTPREGLAVLLAQISYGAFLQPTEVARFLPMYARLLAQTPIRVLSYPHGFAHQDAVCARVMADLAEAG